MIIECLSLTNYRSIDQSFLIFKRGGNLVGPMVDEHQDSFKSACCSLEDLFKYELLDYYNFSYKLKSNLLSLIKQYHKAPSNSVDLGDQESQLIEQAQKLILDNSPTIAVKVSLPFNFSDCSKAQSFVIKIALAVPDSCSKRFLDHDHSNSTYKDSDFLNDHRVDSHQTNNTNPISEFCGHFKTYESGNSFALQLQNYTQEDIHNAQELLQKVPLITQVKIWAIDQQTQDKIKTEYLLNKEQSISFCAWLKMISKINLLTKKAYDSTGFNSVKLSNSYYAKNTWPKLSAYQASYVQKPNHVKKEYAPSVEDIAHKIIAQFEPRLALPEDTSHLICFTKSKIHFMAPEDIDELENFAYQFAFNLMEVKSIFESYMIDFERYKHEVIAKAVKIGNSFMASIESLSSYYNHDLKHHNSNCQELVFCRDLDSFKFVDVENWRLIRAEGLYGKAFFNHHELFECQGNEGNLWLKKLIERYLLLNGGNCEDHNPLIDHSFVQERCNYQKYICYGFHDTDKMVNVCNCFYYFLIDHLELMAAKFVILVEGLSDVLIVEHTARKMGLDLKALGIVVVPFVNLSLVRMLELMSLLQTDYVIIADCDSGGLNFFKEISEPSKHFLLNQQKFWQISTINNGSAHSLLNRTIADIAPEYSFDIIENLKKFAEPDDGWQCNNAISFFTILPDLDLEHFVLSHGGAVNMIGLCFNNNINKTEDGDLTQSCNDIAYTNTLMRLNERLGQLDKEYESKKDKVYATLKSMLDEIKLMDQFHENLAHDNLQIEVVDCGPRTLDAPRKVSDVIATYYNYRIFAQSEPCRLFKLAYLLALVEEANYNQQLAHWAQEQLDNLSLNSIAVLELPCNVYNFVDLAQVNITLLLDTFSLLYSAVEIKSQNLTYLQFCNYTQSDLYTFAGELIDASKEYFGSYLKNKELTQKYSSLDGNIYSRRAYSLLTGFYHDPNHPSRKFVWSKKLYQDFVSHINDHPKELKAMVITKKVIN